MHRLGFEFTIPVFELAKTVHALERAATVIGRNQVHMHKNRRIQRFTLKFRLNIMLTVEEVACEIRLQIIILRRMAFPLS
jgi:hypothetical protein